MIRTSETVDKISAAWVAAAKDMPNIDKTGTGNYGKYVPLGEIVETVRPILATNDLAYVQGVSDGDKLVTITTRLIHKSGEWIEDSVSLPTGQNTAQAVGSAVTYGRRYGLMAILGLAPEDDDGAAASAPARQQQRRSSAPAKASDAQIGALAAAFRDWGVTDRDEKLKHLSRILKRSVPSSKDLTPQECSEAIDTIRLAIQMDSERA